MRQLFEYTYSCFQNPEQRTFLYEAWKRIILFYIRRPFTRRNRDGIRCIRPFYNMELYNDGNCYTCLSTIMSRPIGDLRQKTIIKMYNSVMAKLIRISIYEETFDYCKSSCHVLAEKNYQRTPYEQLDSMWFLTDEQKKAIRGRKITIKKGPSKIAENISLGCNVSCNFCSKPNFLPTPKDLFATYHNHIIQHQENIRILHFCGGEPLIQRTTRDILKSLQGNQNIAFEFVTNLTHLTQEMKQLLQNVQFSYISISINAATADTYSNIVHKGQWSKLMENIRFVAELPQKPELKFSMVVTNQNYFEIIEFAKLGIRQKATSINFHPLITEGNPHLEQFQINHEQSAQIIDLLQHDVFSTENITFENQRLKIHAEYCLKE